MKAKNRGDRTGAVPAAAAAPAKPAAGAAGGAGTACRGPPRLELEGGRKWVVENQVGKKITVEVALSAGIWHLLCPPVLA